MNTDCRIEHASGIRGKFHTVRTIPDANVPCGMNWIADEHAKARAAGKRCRIVMWIDYAKKWIRC